MIGDGVNDVPALKQARLAVAMGSGSQITKGIADIVLLEDEFSMLPKAVAEGRRIARNIHRLGRLYMTKSVLRGVPDPRRGAVRLHLPVPAPAPDGRRAADDRHPLVRARPCAERGARCTAAGCCERWPPSALPAGIGIGIGSLLSFFLVDSIFGGSLADGRTAATTTLIVLGLAFILLLERGPGREHIAIQGYMLAMVTALGALFALILAAAPVREFFDLECCSAPASGAWRSPPSPPAW